MRRLILIAILLFLRTSSLFGQGKKFEIGTGLVPDSVAAAMRQYPELDKRTARKIPNATLI